MICHRSKRSIVSQALASVLVSCLPAAALAQAGTDTGTPPVVGNASPHHDSGNLQFGRLDANHDGSVSRQEFEAYRNATTSRASTTGGALSGTGARTLYASDLIGMDVRNAAGRDSGEIEDLIVDVGSGKVRSAVVSFGGFAGIGDKLYRYPLSDFSSGQSSDGLVLNVSDDAIRSAKGFDRSNWNVGASGNGTGNRGGLWQASNLLGRDVADRNNDHLGEIKDLVVDGSSGQIRYVVMRYDRPWSLDNPLVAVPLHALRFAGDHQTVSMNVDRNEIDTQRMAGGSASPDLWIERWYVVVPQAQGGNANRAGVASGAHADDAAAMSNADTGTSATSSPSAAATASGNIGATSDAATMTATDGVDGRPDRSGQTAMEAGGATTTTPANTSADDGVSRAGAEGSRTGNVTP